MPKKEILSKLQKISSKKLPIFSLFLKIDRKDQPFNKVKITLKNLLKSREGQFESRDQKNYFKAISQKLTEYIQQHIPQTRYHGIAIFAGGDDDIFEVIELNLIPKTVQDILVLEREPFLDVFNFYDKKYKKFALTVTNERQTKLFLVQGNNILKISEYTLTIERKTDREGVFRSGKGSSGGGTSENLDEKEMDLRRHFKQISHELSKIYQTENINALIIAATKKTLPILEKEISKPLTKILTAKWANDFTKLDEVSLLNKVKDFEKNM